MQRQNVHSVPVIWLSYSFCEMAAKDVHISKDGLWEKKLWTNHSKSNHCKKDAETKDMQNYVPLDKGFWEFEAIYTSVQHTMPWKKNRKLFDRL